MSSPKQAKSKIQNFTLNSDLKKKTITPKVFAFNRLIGTTHRYTLDFGPLEIRLEPTEIMSQYLLLVN